MQRERNMLMGVLAVAAGKATPARLGEWSLAEDDLGSLLVTQGVITEAERQTFDGMIEGAFKTLDNDTAQTIPSLFNNNSMAATIASTPSETAATIMTAETMRTDATMQTGAGGWGAPSSGDLVPAVREHAGRYEELRVFGSGGMGQILLVHDSHLGRDVALKTLLPDRFGTQTRGGAPTAAMLTVPIIARFLQEARITGQLEHPAIVPVYELGYRDDGTLYYTMKLVRGRTLSDALAETKTLADRLAYLKHFLDICYAIAYAHSRGVIHRDIKPLNMMIGEFGETVVLDWGIAKLRGQADIHAKGLSEGIRTLRLGDAEATAKTMHGQTIGSPFYMPPEQAAGRTDEINDKSDIYSLGALLYHLLAGVPPYHGNTARQFLEKVVQFPPKPVREIEPNAPPELVAVCERAMQPDAAKRYDNAKELAEEIERYISGGLVRAYEYKLSELVKRFVRKHAKMIATIAVALVVLIAVSIYSYVRVVQARDVAIEQRALAVKSEEAAVIARDSAEERLYFANIGLAQNAIEERRVGEARTLLAESPVAHRAWEWGHLQALANADAMTIKAGGRHVGFTPDGQFIVTGTPYGGVGVRDLRTGETVHILSEQTDSSYAMDVGGGLVAVHAADGITVWDARSGEQRYRREDAWTGSGQRHLVLSADGVYLAALNSDKKVRVIRVADGTELFTVSVPQAQGFNLVFAPAPTGHLLITQSEFGDSGWVRTFSLYGLPDGAVVGRGEIPDPLSAYAAAISPGAKWIALGTDDTKREGDLEGGLQIWEVATWQKVANYVARFEHPNTIAFSPDGSHLAAGTKDGHVIVVDLNTMTMQRDDLAHQDIVRAVTFTPDSKYFITGSFDRTAKIWDPATLATLETLRGHDQSLLALACNPVAPLLASASFDGTTKLWRLDQDFAYARARLVAASLAHGVAAGALDKEAALWDTRTGQRLHTLSGHTGRIKAVALDTDATMVATVAREGDGAAAADVARFWHVADGSPAGTATLGTDSQHLAFLNGTSLLAVRDGTTLTLYDTASGAAKQSIPSVESFVASEDGQHFATAVAVPESKGNYTLSVYGVENGAPQATLPVAAGSACTLYFAQHGARLYAGAAVNDASGKLAGRIYTLDIATGQPGPVLDGHAQKPLCFAESFDGKLLATGSSDKSVIVWDIATGKALQTLTGHASNINAVAFSPDGSRLATASSDGTFRLWVTGTGKGVLTLQRAALEQRGQVLQPKQVAFSPDALRLMTLTDPDALPPVLLKAFPWDSATFSGKTEDELDAQVEAYKRKDAGLAALLPAS